VEFSLVAAEVVQEDMLRDQVVLMVVAVQMVAVETDLL
tara:strand:- start:149 stop:262 length:114 start_codon:yes stop_codon:yes gene_type:complete